MAHGIQHLTHLVENLQTSVDCIASRLEAMERLVKDIPTDQDLNTALDGLSQAVTQAVTDATTRVQTDIDALKAQIANGQPVTQADLDKIAAVQQQTLAGIANIDPANPTPPPPPPGP